MKYVLIIVFFFMLNGIYSQSIAYANIFVAIIEAPITITSNCLKIDKIKLINSITNNITYIKFTAIDIKHITNIKYATVHKDSLFLSNKFVKVINVE